MGTIFNGGITLSYGENAPTSVSVQNSFYIDIINSVMYGPYNRLTGWPSSPVLGSVIQQESIVPSPIIPIRKCKWKLLNGAYIPAVSNC